MKSSAIRPLCKITSLPPYNKSITPIITPKLSVIGAAFKSNPALFR
jgi:hypothetical protein